MAGTSCSRCPFLPERRRNREDLAPPELELVQHFLRTTQHGTCETIVTRPRAPEQQKVFLLIETEHFGPGLTFEPRDIPREDLTEQLLLRFPFAGRVVTHAADHTLEHGFVFAPWAEAQHELL